MDGIVMFLASAFTLFFIGVAIVLVVYWAMLLKKSGRRQASLHKRILLAEQRAGQYRPKRSS